MCMALFHLRQLVWQSKMYLLFHLAAKNWLS
jgi:hypothetical protein